MQYVLILDKLIGLVTMFLNVLGASQKVSDIIAKRIAEGRDWTDAEKAEVEADLQSAEDRADQAITAAGA